MTTAQRTNIAQADLEEIAATWIAEIENLESLSRVSPDEGYDSIFDWISARPAITHIFRLAVEPSPPDSSAQPDWSGVELMLFDGDIRATLIWNWGDAFVILQFTHGLHCVARRIGVPQLIDQLNSLDGI